MYFILFFVVNSNDLIFELEFKFILKCDINKKNIYVG